MTTAVSAPPAGIADRVAHSRAGLPVALGVLATGVGAAGSGIPAPWRDEDATVLAATRDLDQLAELVTTRLDAVHALYYALMHVWLQLVPLDPFWLRLPGAVAVGAAVAGAVVLGRMLGGTWAGVLAGLVLLTVPRVLWSAVEARSAAGQLALGVWLTIAFVAALRGSGARRWVVWGAAAAIASAFFLFLVLLAGVQVLSLLVTREGRRRLRPALLALAAVVVLLVPLAWLAYLQRDQVAWIGDAEDVPYSLVIGQWFVSGPFYAGAAYLVLALALVLLVRRRARGRRPSAAVLALLLFALLGPTVLLAATELGPIPLYVGRYTVGSIPAFAVLVGLGLARLPRVAGIAAVVLLGALAIPNYLQQRTVDAKSDWDALAADVEELAAPGDAIYFAAPEAGDQTRGISTFYPEAVEGLDDVALVEDGATAGTLYDVVRPMSETIRELEPGQRLVTVLPHDVPESDETVAALASAGYDAIAAEDTGWTSVTVWSR